MSLQFSEKGPVVGSVNHGRLLFSFLQKQKLSSVSMVPVPKTIGIDASILRGNICLA